LHGVLAGSDSGQPWMMLVYLFAGVSVILMSLVRLLWLPEGTPSTVPPSSPPAR
jgi:hypothetical protein